MSFVILIIRASIVAFVVLAFVYILLDLCISIVLILLSTLGLLDIDYVCGDVLMVSACFKRFMKRRKLKAKQKQSQILLKKFLRILKDNQNYKDAYPLFIKNFNDENGIKYRDKSHYPSNIQLFFEDLYIRYEDLYYIFVFMFAFDLSKTKEGEEYWRKIATMVEEKHLLDKT